jgi:hypothetical protein
MNLPEAKIFTNWFSGWLMWFVIIMFLLQFLPIARDDSDGAWPNRSGLKPATDALTGCQYLKTWSGSITPRLDANGKQVCIVRTE